MPERQAAERRQTPREPGEQPPRRPRSRVFFHGLRGGVLLALAVATWLLFPSASEPGAPVLERGVVAPADVIARVGFQIPKTEDELRQERDEAARGVPPVLDYVPQAADSVVAGIDGFFARLDAAERAAAPARRGQAVQQVLSQSGIPTTLGVIDVLGDSAQAAALHAATVRAVRRELPRGVAASSPGREGISTVRVRGIAGAGLVPADSLRTADQFYRAARGYLPPTAGADAAEVQRLLLVRWFHPSLAVNERETDASRARARGAVDPVKYRVLPGEKIVGAREQVGAREEERLRAYQAALGHGAEGRPGRAWARALGSILHDLLLLGIVGLLLRLSRAHLYGDDRSVVFLGFLTLFTVAMAALIARMGLPTELIPVPFVALVVAVLWGGRLALAIALVLALVLGGQPPLAGVTVPFTAAVGGAAAAFGVRVARRRLQTWMVVGIIAASYAAAAVTVGLLRGWTPRDVGWSVAWGAINALGSSLLAVGFLPVAEWITRVTTNQTLQELADPKHPLLQRLSMEAPGTYAHTISVANLAEAVCNAIGANALLARVGVYYHDIGKVVKPHYFIENQPKGRNPHDKLKPSMSAAIVRSHVAEGLKLAEQHRLPDAVKAFIAQHHGTQSISFFLQQARDRDPGARLDSRDFSYAGPRPQTREVAVVMLADSVESAARVLADPTPERVRELVDRIVNAKVASGQLDQSPLTLRELARAREVLARGVSSMYHQRVDYPPVNGAASGGDAPAEKPAAPVTPDASVTTASGDAAPAQLRVGGLVDGSARTADAPGGTAEGAANGDGSPAQAPAATGGR